MKNKNIEYNKRCVFIGGKQIGVDCLKQLLAKGVTPQLVIANMDDDGNTLWHESLVKAASQYKLPLIKKLRVSNPHVINEIKKINPEIIFCIGGTQIIPEEVLNIPTLGCLNIHPALLPKYRGRYSTVHAIFNGEKKTGVTAHWMDTGIDSGPIIKQKKITITNSDTARTLYDKFTTVGGELFKEVIDQWLLGKKIHSKPQDERKATYYPKGLPNNGEINWNWNGKKIYNFIKAMTFEPFSPASFTIGDKNMVIVDEKYVKKL
jgi:UDP-4-amino-4-deoxy-L-arabinose formyltransferase/UDP-glucuronic acid dehydrogenase (UDP-4-keto-hexauronic acid decarboxylating)